MRPRRPAGYVSGHYFVRLGFALAGWDVLRLSCGSLAGGDPAAGPPVVLPAGTAGGAPVGVGRGTALVRLGAGAMPPDPAPSRCWAP